MFLFFECQEVQVLWAQTLEKNNLLTNNRNILSAERLLGAEAVSCDGSGSLLFRITDRGRRKEGVQLEIEKDRSRM